MAHRRIAVFHESNTSPFICLNNLDCMKGCDYQLIEHGALASSIKVSLNEKCDGFFSSRTGLITQDLIALSLPISFQCFAEKYFYYLLQQEIQFAQKAGLSLSVLDVHI